MKKIFSDDLLRKIRNDIPINFVISNLLNIHSKLVDGYLRFLCPICNDFHTATQSSTNLARCFRCQRNFNVIDFVMLVKNYSFKKSVTFLKNYWHNQKLQPDFLKSDTENLNHDFNNIRSILNYLVNNKKSL